MTNCCLFLNPKSMFELTFTSCYVDKWSGVEAILVKAWKKVMDNLVQSPNVFKINLRHNPTFGVGTTPNKIWCGWWSLIFVKFYWVVTIFVSEYDQLWKWSRNVLTPKDVDQCVALSQNISWLEYQTNIFTPKFSSIFRNWTSNNFTVIMSTSNNIIIIVFDKVVWMWLPSWIKLTQLLFEYRYFLLFFFF